MTAITPRVTNPCGKVAQSSARASWRRVGARGAGPSETCQAKPSCQDTGHLALPPIQDSREMPRESRARFWVAPTYRLQYKTTTLTEAFTEACVAVLAEMYSVVVRASTVRDDYPGGVEAYACDSPNRTFCTDGELCRVGFMSWTDTEAFLASLRLHAICLETDGVAVIREDKGLLQASQWLEFACEEGTPVGRLRGSTVASFAAQAGWVPGRFRALMTDTELREGWDQVSEVDGVITYRHRTSGDVRYIGRTTIPSRGKPWWRFWSGS